MYIHGWVCVHVYAVSPVCQSKTQSNLCMHAYVCGWVGGWMCLSMYIYRGVCVCVYICLCMQARTHMCVCVCVYAYVHTWVCVCLCTYVCACRQELRQTAKVQKYIKEYTRGDKQPPLFMLLFFYKLGKECDLTTLTFISAIMLLGCGSCLDVIAAVTLRALGAQ